MPVIVPALGLAYFPVPKNACTTLKHAFYAINEGRPFIPGRNAEGRFVHIHTIPGYGTAPASAEGFERAAGYARLAVIRDPIRRLVSCWKNRVRHHWELSEKVVGAEVLAARGLQPNPPFELFIERLADYRAVSGSITHHTELQVVFLGRDPAQFEHVHRVEDMAAVQALLTERAGWPIELGHEQRGGSHLPDPEIPAETRRRMLDYAAEDYDHWRFE